MPGCLEIMGRFSPGCTPARPPERVRGSPLRAADDKAAGHRFVTCFLLSFLGGGGRETMF